MPQTKFTTVSIPLPLAKKIRELIDDSGFTSMSDFVTFILREILAEGANEDISSLERERIRERLKALGYID